MIQWDWHSDNIKGSRKFFAARKNHKAILTRFGRESEINFTALLRPGSGEISKKRSYRDILGSREDA